MKNNSNGSTIQVALRKRPLMTREVEGGKGAEVVQIINERQINLLDPDEISREYNLNYNINKNRFKETHFTFDAVFDEKSTNHDVYTGIGSVFLKDILEGFNTTVFAYGATGAGKTYTQSEHIQKLEINNQDERDEFKYQDKKGLFFSFIHETIRCSEVMNDFVLFVNRMIGQRDVPGFMDMMLEGLFDRAKVKEQTHDVKIRIAYMEIYNENLKDLLSNEGKNLDLREDPKSDLTQVHGLTEVEVTDHSEVSGIIRIGSKNRSKDSTISNEVSSRSHAILQVQVECFDRGEGLEKEIITSKLSLVDLAGSERAWANKSKVNKLEGAKINQSLLTLGNCIQALSEIGDKGPNKNSFVPFRGSKLTRLLKDSLGGNCRTIMIANISGSILSFEDTYNTLMYASRAKNIKLHVQKNVIQSSNHVSNYAAIIEKLNKENENLRNILNGDKVIQNVANPQNIIGNQVDPQQAQLEEQFEQMILHHFNDEAGCLRTISENQLKFDKLSRINNSYQSELRRLPPSSTGSAEHTASLREQLMINSQGMVLIANTIQDQVGKYKALQEGRKQLMQKIKSNALIPNKIQQVLQNQFSIRELNSENIEKEYAFKKNSARIREKEIELSSLSEQLQIRDNIILQQKQILKKNDHPSSNLIKDAALILSSMNQQNNSHFSSIQNNSVESELSAGSSPYQLRRNMHNNNNNNNNNTNNYYLSPSQRSKNLSSQERGARVLKNALSFNDIHSQVKPQQSRALLSAKSQGSINIKLNSNIPQASNIQQQKFNQYPYLRAKKTKLQQLVNLGQHIPVSGNQMKKNTQNISLNEESSSINNSYQEAQQSPSSRVKSLKQNGNKHQNQLNSAIYLEGFDSLSSRKSTNMSPKQSKQRQLAGIGSQKNTQSTGSLPNIQQRKNFVEFDVHKSPYVKPFVDPAEVAQQSRKNKLMNLNQNLGYLKDVYTKKFLENS